MTNNETRTATGKQPRVPRAGRPSTALITPHTAAEAALKVIDRDGLATLSLQDVARALGVSAPSLYHHFKDKDELLAHVARLLLEMIGVEQATWPVEWEERLIALSLATRRVMLRHPNAAPLALRFFPRRIMLQAYENSLADCPYPAEVQLIISEMTEKLTYGSALFAAAAESHHIAAMPEVDPAQFPSLARALAAAPPEEEVFIQALRTQFAGMHARFTAQKPIAKQRAGTATPDLGGGRQARISRPTG